MKRIVITRHGNTFAAGETPRRVGTKSDPPLTAEGERQASVLGAWLSREGFDVDRAFSGPLRRTQQTCRIICRHLAPPPIWRTSGWLDEIDYGPDEGATEEDVQARIGSEALTAWDRRGVVPTGWIADGEARVAAWRRLFVEPGASTSLLVTSNGAARFALIAAELVGRCASLKLRTGAYGILAGPDGGPIELLAWDVRP